MASRKVAEKPQKHRSLRDPPGNGNASSSFPSVASSSPSPLLVAAAAAAAASRNGHTNGANVDKVLYKNLVDMAPLVESLMDRKANPSLRRRAAVSYTPTPSNPSKNIAQKGRKTAQICSTVKQDNQENNISDKHTDNGDVAADFSIFTSPPTTTEDAEIDAEELSMLQEQLDGLQKQLLEKDGQLQSLKEDINAISVVNSELEKLKQQVAEKDSSIIDVNVQLANTKVKLSEKQAHLENLESEVATSNNKVEELRGQLQSTEFEISSFRKLFGELSKMHHELKDDIATFEPTGCLQYIDNIDEIDIRKMEEARVAYIGALAAAKDNPTEESLAAAAEARLQLYAII